MKVSNLEKLCRIVLGDQSDRLKYIVIDKLDEGTWASTICDSYFPYRAAIKFDKMKLIESTDNELLDTIIHECHHILTDQTFYSISMGDTINITSLSFLNENSAEAAAFLAINCADNIQEINNLIMEFKNDLYR